MAQSFHMSSYFSIFNNFDTIYCGTTQQRKVDTTYNNLDTTRQEKRHKKIKENMGK